MDNLISEYIEIQRNYFNSGKTKDINFRISQLKTLLKLVDENESRILEAISKDLGRHIIDSYMGDVGPLKKSINYTIKNLKKWATPKKVHSMTGTKSIIQPEPLGNVLIIAPWNYPFLLLLDPLVGAIAAGNCAILKPSEITVNTATLLNELISSTFEPDYIKVIEGGVEETKYLLEQKFDHIFFTGSTSVGKIIYQAASKNLTPVTLELGGKSPCIIDENTDIKITARRIIWGKLFNNGQTCTSPDYVFVDKKIKETIINEFKKCILEFYGENPQVSPYYSRIVNEKNFDRLEALLHEGRIIHGGKTDRNDLYIEPTIIDNISPDFKIMQEEIFGPLLPIFEYENVQEAIDYINKNPKPLAAYVFTKNKKFYENIVKQASAGGMSINDTLMHVTSEHLPFGGVGESGIGKYHGKYSFDTFSNYKSIFINTFLFDRDLLYPPYKLCLKWAKRLLSLL